jgi:hypothetical protein
MIYVWWAVIHIGLWFLMLAAAAGVGRLLLRRFEFDSISERLVFTLTLGLGACAWIFFVIGAVGLMSQKVIVGFTVAMALFFVLKTALNFSPARFKKVFSDIKSQPLKSTLWGVLGALGIAWWLFLLAGTQYPPIAWDATDEHLVVAREFLEARGPVALTGLVEPVLPSLNHTFFAWGMALRDDVLSQMMEHTFLMLGAIALFAWGRRQHVWLGIALATFWLSNPLVQWLGESGYVDICVVTFVFVGLYALRIFWLKREARWWYLAMAILGLSTGAKISGLFFAGLGMITGLIALAHARWFLKSEDAAKQASGKVLSLNSLVVGWAVGLIALAPWYGFILFHTGNPVWPAFGHLLSRGPWKGPGATSENFFAYSPEPRTLKSFLRLSIDWFKNPHGFLIGIPQPLNPLVFVWPVVWLTAIFIKEVRWWALWAMGFTLFWFMHAQDLRYWLPALPLVAVALFESIRWLVDRFRTPWITVTVFVLLTIFSFGKGVRYTYGALSYKPLPPTNEDARERFLQVVSGYGGVSFINSQAGPDDVVVVVNGSWLVYHLKPEVIDMNGFFQIGKYPSFHWPEDEWWVRWMESRRVSWILVNYGSREADLLKRPVDDPANKTIWPDYQLVFARGGTWVFYHPGPLPDKAR